MFPCQITAFSLTDHTILPYINGLRQNSGSELFKVLEEVKQPCGETTVLSSLAHVGSPEKRGLTRPELREAQSPKPDAKAGRSLNFHTITLWPILESTPLVTVLTAL